MAARGRTEVAVSSRAQRVPAGGSVRAALAPAALRSAAGAQALQGSRAVVDAVRRIDEFIVRYLDVARCGVWAVAPDAHSASCVDLFARDVGVHRREADRDGSGAAALHRRLLADGIVATTAEQADAGLLPPGASGALAVALCSGGQLLVYLCAEQVGAERSWTADEQRFMRSMTDVMREVFTLAGAESVPPAEASFFAHLPIVAYRGARIGEHWTLTLVSEGAERVLGRRAGELIGQPVHALRQMLADIPPSLPASGEFEHGYQRYAVDAPARRFSEKGRVGVDAEGGAPLIEGVITDITGSVDPTPDASAHFELLTHVSHELRTPLNAILGFAQLIELDPANTAAQRHEYVTQIQRAGRHLLEVIRETMDLTRLQAGPLGLAPEPLRLARVVEDCLPMVANQAVQARVQLVNAVHDPALEVVADPRALQQALVNLLSNAVKYNRVGGSVRVEAEPFDDSVRLRVTDTGIGLSAQQTEALFKPFDRLGMERSDIEGVGLGLVITRRLIEAMGGRISVSSQPGVGSTFEVVLPGRAPG